MSRIASLIPAFAAGLALVWLAVPRTAASVAGLPARPVVAELRSGETVAARYVDIAADSQRAALRWADDGRNWADLGLLLSVQGQANGLAGDAGKALLDEVIATHRRGLERSPAQAYVWTRLSHAELLRRGPAPMVGPMLALAITTAPLDRRLAFSRLELCLVLWRQLNPAMRDRVVRQIRFAAWLDAKRLAEMAKRRYAMTVVRDALVGTPDLRGAFDSAFLKL